MEYIENIDIKNKKVILRLDLNVTIKNGEIMDDTKIVKSIPTIKYLLNNGCNILIMSHLGKIKSLDDQMQNSLNKEGNIVEEKNSRFFKEEDGFNQYQLLSDLKRKNNR